MNIDHLREFTYLAETLSFAVSARHFFIGVIVLMALTIVTVVAIGRKQAKRLA